MKTRNANASPVANQATPAGSRAAEGRDLLWQARQLPNLLTLARLAAVPVFVWAWNAGRHRLALALFAAAVATDFVDGLLARVLHMRTRLGGILDPVADKLLTLAALTALTVDGRLPAWLLGLVLFRDLGIAAGVLALRVRGHEVPASPTRLGKYSTFLLAATMALSMANELLGGEALRAWESAALVLAASCVALGIVQYSAAWRRLMRAPLP